MCGPYFALGSENTDCASLCCFGFLLLKLWGHVLLVQGSDYYDCAGAYCSQCVGLIVSYHWVLPVKGSCLFLGPAVFYKSPLFLLYLVSTIIQCISLYNTIPIVLLFFIAVEQTSGRLARVTLGFRDNVPGCGGKLTRGGR